MRSQAAAEQAAHAVLSTASALDSTCTNKLSLVLSTELNLGLPLSHTKEQDASGSEDMELVVGKKEVLELKREAK